MAETFDPDNVTMQDAKTGEIPADLTDNIITSVKTGSAIMKLAKAVPMTKPRERFTFMSGVGAYWTEEGQKIQTSKPTFTPAFMVIQDEAVAAVTPSANQVKNGKKARQEVEKKNKDNDQQVAAAKDSGSGTTK